MKEGAAEQVKTLKYTIPASPAVGGSPTRTNSIPIAGQDAEDRHGGILPNSNKCKTVTESSIPNNKKQIFLVGGYIILAVIAIAVTAIVVAVVVSQKKSGASAVLSTTPSSTTWPNTTPPTQPPSQEQLATQLPTTIEWFTPVPVTRQPETPSPSPPKQGSDAPYEWSTSSLMTQSPATAAPVTEEPTMPNEDGGVDLVRHWCTANTSNIAGGDHAANDICERAFLVSTDSSLLCGTIFNNKNTSNVPVACMVIAGSQGPPVWYQLEGTGERIVITTCNSQTNFDTVLSVFEEALCTSESCQASEVHDTRSWYDGSFVGWTAGSLAANDDDGLCQVSPNGASTVTFDSVAGQLYKFYVAEKQGSNGGTFGLTVTSMKAPINDRCENAILLETNGMEVTGSTTNATIDWQVVTSCVFSHNIRGASVWFTIEGTGERIVVTTCSRTTDIDTVLAVYNDAICNNQNCQASTIHGLRSWYDGSFEGWVAEYWAANDDDAACKDTPLGASTVTFDSVAGRMYKLYVSEKYARIGGTFGIKATSMKAPANDRCESAIHLDTNSVEVLGSTVNATIDWHVVSSCAFLRENIRGASVWYTLEGTGERIVVTTCSGNTDFDTALAVYDTADCSTHNCLPSTIHDDERNWYDGRFTGWVTASWAANDNDNNCRLTGSGASTVEFDSEAGKWYKLYVSEKGPSRSGGTFGLRATSMKAPTNDRCMSATFLDADGVEIIGNTMNATIDWHVQESCVFSRQNIRSASVWYILEGTGQKVTITTCSSNTDFDTVLGVYNDGDCDDYSCLVSNDNDDRCRETRIGASTVTFDTVAGQMYKFYVSGKSGRNGGTFGLSARSEEDTEE